jgi:hypothetical protein
VGPVSRTTVCPASILLTKTRQGPKVDFQNKGKLNKLVDFFQKTWWTQKLNKIDIFGRIDLSISIHVGIDSGIVTLASIVSKSDDSIKIVLQFPQVRLKLFS